MGEVIFLMVNIKNFKIVLFLLQCHINKETKFKIVLTFIIHSEEQISNFVSISV